MDNILDLYTAQQAWDLLQDKIANYYRGFGALFSGDHDELKATGINNSFWRRKGKAKVHVPIAADIASTSADLLFAEEPRFSIFDKGKELEEGDALTRLAEIVDGNNFKSMLHEAAESAAALGDVFLKINYSKSGETMPRIAIVHADEAYPEYRMGRLVAVHFYTILKVEERRGIYWRVYEQYRPGAISMAIYKGTVSTLGEQQEDGILEEMGYQPETVTPIGMMLATHIPNMKPSRIGDTGDCGRSDFEGLRDLMDSLDEAFSSLMRDVRLGKARLYVPAEYLRRKVETMFGENDRHVSYDFDQDVETLVAVDFDPDKPGTQAITPSQFNIRSKEHLEIIVDTCRRIYSMAGYSPQTFGMDISGEAQSGTALNIRERKSSKTRGKKANYWRGPIQHILTAVMQLDAALYGANGTHAEDVVKITFGDSSANDTATMASTLAMLHTAQAISTKSAVQALNPGWSEKQVEAEVQAINTQFGLADVADADPAAGDYHGGADE